MIKSLECLGFVILALGVFLLLIGIVNGSYHND